MRKFWKKDAETSSTTDVYEELRLNIQGANDAVLARTRELALARCRETEPKPGKRPSRKFLIAVTGLGTLDYEVGKMRRWQKGNERRE